MRLTVFAVLTSCLLKLCALGMGSRPEGYTLVLVPDQYGPVQITHDLAQLHPVVMASYEHPGDAAKLNIHVFQDGKWLPISGPSFQSGGFLRVKPTRTIVVGQDNAVTGALLNIAGAWNSQQVLNIPFNNGTDLINWYGKYFNFSKGDFRWFANKYKLDVQDHNEGDSRPSWYDQPYTEDTRAATEFREPPAAAPVAIPGRAAPATTPRSAGFKSTTVPGAPGEPAPSVKPIPPPPAPKAVELPPVTPPAEATRAFDDAAAPSTPLVNEPGTPAFKGWKNAEAPAPK